MPTCCNALCALLIGVIFKGLTLPKFVFDVCLCFMFVKGSVEWI